MEDSIEEIVMAVIGIRKLIEINDTGYYAVSVQSDEKFINKKTTLLFL